MAYYTYYRNSQPTWGTQQYQSVAPPMPQYQPQPSWHGADYYRAHAGGNPDSTLFNSVWSKVKRMVSGGGVGRTEAKYWWKRVYGGLIEPSQLLPRDLGAAAGYEAIRCWEYHRSIYVQPLSDNREREKEALIGLAAAEASKLWSYTMRPLDTRGCIEASEVAAATAAHIFRRSSDYDSPYGEYERSPRSRRRSISGPRYGADFSDDDYDMPDSRRTDYLDAYPSHGRRGLTRRSSSLYRRSPTPYARRSPSPYSRRSPSPYARRSPSPMALGGGSGAVGLPTSAYTPQYATDGLGGGIPGVYYPAAAASGSYGYPQSAGAYTSYQQLPRSSSPYGYGGESPYMNRTYAGSSVGLPPPPTGQYLAAPGMTRHHRSHSAGSYGAVRPTFGY